MTPNRTCLLGITVGLPVGWLAGFALPWWVAGAPCYLVAIVLWQRGLRGPMLTGIWCGSLAAAATHLVVTGVMVGVFWILSLLPWPLRPWGEGIWFYMASAGASFLWFTLPLWDWSMQ